MTENQKNNELKKTVFLPQTGFPMRAGLATLEESIVARWQKIDLYKLLRQDRKGAEKFILHDGPPYANGHLHIGHAVNKILKDVITRLWQMKGFDSNYVPGWDCHGLPIEWKVEEDYRAKGRMKNDVPVDEFRKTCRDFANHWIGIQMEGFKRLGVVGDWDRPYKTMDFAAEAQIFREFTKFLNNGGLYAGSRPVLWSVVEQTALADAEVEYEDITSPAIFVAFKVVDSPRPELVGAEAVIWTTTPWTIPGNRAVAFNPELDYVLVKARHNGLERRLILAKALVEKFAAETAIEIDPHFLAEFGGEKLAETMVKHPLAELHEGYHRLKIPMLPGDHVTADAGTGLVHTAPGHGVEDFELGKKFNLEIPITVQGDGIYAPLVPLFAGEHVFKVDEKVIAALNSAGTLLGNKPYRHSYPHSWRSKKKLIFRNTPQWFISMETNGLRQKALAAIDATTWYPKGARNRLYAMIEQRPDWCISRQRSWGVPLAVFIDKATGVPLRDDAVNQRIADAFETEGGDAWFNSPPSRFLGADFNADNYDQIKDVIEVWFDSGASHSYVLEARPELRSPADMYLEGTDQHRGWFHTSLLESCGTRGVAPFKSVLTHGFALDPQGRKMSKSLGNVVAPLDVARSHGIDILRLWVVSSDYTEDLRIGPDILNQQAELYRRLRNSLRYLLGGLAGWDDAESINHDQMPELEQYILSRLAEVDRAAHDYRASYQFHKLYALIHEFCAVELSAFYFDIRKDALYCDAADSVKRRANRTVMKHLLDWLLRWLAPVLCFTAEEAYGYRPGATGEETDSVHRLEFIEIDAGWYQPQLNDKWLVIKKWRETVLKSNEELRASKTIGSSLEVRFELTVPAEDYAVLDSVDFAEVCIVSELTLHRAEQPSHRGVKSTAAKCERCWKHLPTVHDHSGNLLCERCSGVI
ncbi:MAG: isoleucine--tRNA ligase [Candidatus Pacebacteria bacterium]|nr:isoleucine--tRNA ligase [Candidatus Paceibacterota bacterium]